MDYFGLMKGFILSPVETFREVRDTDLGDSLKYYLVLLVINAVLSAIVGIAMVSAVWLTFSGIAEQLGVPLPAIAGVGVVLFAIVMIVVQFILVFIGAAWLHIFVYLLGGQARVSPDPQIGHIRLHTLHAPGLDPVHRHVCRHLVPGA